jgi:SAM-dependent methyltransferase
MKLNEIQNFLNDKSVLEIGGPSRLLNFIYEKVKLLDILNYATSMEKHSQVGNAYGTVYLGDATEECSFKQIDKKYDVIITSHTLEHIANPIKALNIWKNLLNRDGVIINILPNKNHCWDRNREFTPFRHIVKDFLENISENDLTHLEESSCMLETKPTYYQEVGSDNKYRVIHHHCFNETTLKQMHEFNSMFYTKHCYIAKDDNLQLIYVGCKK